MILKTLYIATHQPQLFTHCQHTIVLTGTCLIHNINRTRDNIMVIYIQQNS